MSWGYGSMMSWGYAPLGLVTWIIVLIDLILLGIFLWKKIQK